MATGNHFWLDIAAGIVVAGVAAAVVYRPWRQSPRARRRGMSVKTAYTAGRARDRGPLDDGPRTRPGDAEHAHCRRRDALRGRRRARLLRVPARGALLLDRRASRSSSARCWTSSTAALARAAASRRRSAASSTRRSTASARVDARLDPLVFMRDGQELALAFAVAAIGASPSSPVARAKAEGPGSRATSASARAPSASSHLGRARARAVGRAAGDRRPRRAPRGSRVLQRILHVRRELRSSVSLDRRLDDACAASVLERMPSLR